LSLIYIYILLLIRFHFILFDFILPYLFYDSFILFLFKFLSLYCFYSGPLFVSFCIVLNYSSVVFWL